MRRRLSLPEFAAHVGRGFVIGSADLVPGVSGGTMALILGIYVRLVTAIGAFTRREVWRQLGKGRVGGAWATADVGFLGALGLGIVGALVLLSNLLEFLLTTYEPQVYATFAGLILASVFLVGKRVEAWGTAAVVGLGAGAVGAFLLVGLSPTTTPTTPLFLAASGALAVCALILPGISGAFILVLLGKYRYVLEKLGNGEIVALLPVIGGAALGLLAFSRVLEWLLEKHQAVTLAVLSGFLLGSVRKVWPWQETTGTLTVNVAPPPGFMEVGVAAALALAGAALVIVLDRLGSET